MVSKWRISKAAVWLLLAILLAAGLVLARSGLFIRSSEDARDSPAGQAPPLPAVGLPGAVPPEKELLPFTPQTARELNAARPFSTAATQPAPAFSSTLDRTNQARAEACLAIAALYEAGGSRDDQMPVMQVILNRVRHPAFPNTVCGVVFQGSERRTGCQFTFTCDGSMQRWRPSSDSYERARLLARSMLDSHVDKRVGLATHYHTDWVLPYWSASLEKLAGVRTHLFFRWPGYWGSRSALRTPRDGAEPVVPVLHSYSSAHAITSDAEQVIVPAPVGPVAAAPAADHRPTVRTPSGIEAPVELVRLPLQPGAMPGRWALDALSLCDKRPDCRVVGWSDPAREPAALNRASLISSPPDLLFVQELRNRTRQAYWDCAKWPKAPTSRCLRDAADASTLIYGR